MQQQLLLEYEQYLLQQLHHHLKPVAVVHFSL
jgi:hypothetical protein